MITEIIRTKSVYKDKNITQISKFYKLKKHTITYLQKQAKVVFQMQAQNQ